MQKCVEYCKSHSKKKIDFFNKNKLNMIFFTTKHIKIHI